jgi:hypothetical protein
MRRLTTALLAIGLAGCGSATSGIAPGALAITAQDAFFEARTAARVWDPGARLRYVEGLGVDANGRTAPETGEWRFHYTASGKTGELLVRVAPLATEQEERAATSPPGYVLGDNALDDDWVDSPLVLEAVNATNASVGSATLLLVPTNPSQWIVRPTEGDGRWRVNAETGEVIGG